MAPRISLLIPFPILVIDIPILGILHLASDRVPGRVARRQEPEPLQHQPTGRRIEIGIAAGARHPATADPPIGGDRQIGIGGATVPGRARTGGVVLT